MNPTASRSLGCATLALALAAGLGALAQDPPAATVPPEAARAEEVIERYGDLVSIFGGDVAVPTNVRQHGNVVVLGGHARIEGAVSGDVVVIFGSLDNRGTVDGAVAGIFSEQRHTNARIGGKLVNVFGTANLENTRVSEELVSILGGFRRDTTSSGPSVNIGFGSFPDLRGLILWLRLLRLFGVFVMLLLLVAIVPERVALIAEEAPVRYATAFFVGLLGYLGLLVVLGLLTVTVIGLPLAWLGWVVLKWLGIAGILLAVGRRLGRTFGRDMSRLGAVMLAFGLYAAITLAPTPLGLLGLPISLLIGTFFFVLVEVPAVGLALVTYAGGRPGRRRDSPAPPAPPAAAPATHPPVV